MINIIRKELESGVKASHPLIPEYYKKNIKYVYLESDLKWGQSFSSFNPEYYKKYFESERQVSQW